MISKVASKLDGGGYAYSKYQINGGEIALAVVALYYGWSIIVPAASVAASYALQW